MNISSNYPFLDFGAGGIFPTSKTGKSSFFGGHTSSSSKLNLFPLRALFP